MRRILLAEGLARFDGAALLLLRLFLGAFLIYGVWDNIVDPARMDEFQAFLTALNCPLPAVAAPLSVWSQFLVGLLLISGLATRWAGLLLTANFIVAVGLIAPTGASFRDLFPPTVLIFIGLVFATSGAGDLSIDRQMARRRGGFSR